MSKLLFQLREQLRETSTTASISYYGASRNRRRRQQDSVDKLVSRAASSDDDELQEAAILFMEARAHVQFTRSEMHPLYRSTMRSLGESVATVSAPTLYRLYSKLEPLLETGSTEPSASQDVHGKFVKALLKKFGVESLCHTSINDGVFIHLDDEQSHVLATAINDVRKFAAEQKYLVLRKGTFSSGDDQVWVFVADPNSGEEIGTISDEWK